MAADYDNKSEDSNAEAPLSPWGNKCKAKLEIWKELDDPLSAIHLMEVDQIHKNGLLDIPWAGSKQTSRI